MQNMDISTSIKNFTGIVKKTHYFAFGLVLLIIIGITFYFVYNLLNMPADSVFENKLAAQKTIDNFDKDPTIPRINKLEFSAQNTPIELPSDQRLNPFSE